MRATAKLLPDEMVLVNNNEVPSCDLLRFHLLSLFLTRRHIDRNDAEVNGVLFRIVL